MYNRINYIFYALTNVKELPFFDENSKYFCKRAIFLEKVYRIIEVIKSAQAESKKGREYGIHSDDNAPKQSGV